MRCRAFPLLLGPVLLALGCGAPLVDGAYAGEPTFTLQGRFEGSVFGVDPQGDGLFVRGAIFWNPHGTAAFASFDELVEQPATGRAFRIPGPTEWHLFEEPDPEHLTTTPGGEPVGVGLPLFYSDLNRNLRRDPDERMVIHTPTAAVIFAPRALSAAESPTGRAMPAGYSTTSKPIACPPTPPPAAEDDCGVPLGATCQGHGDCGARGVCVSEGPWWPTDGFCAIPEPSPDGCRPRGGALFRDSRDAARAFWVKACGGPADCKRGFPFQCDFTFGACLPTAYILFYGEHALGPRPICATSP